MPPRRGAFFRPFAPAVPSGTAAPTPQAPVVPVPPPPAAAVQDAPSVPFRPALARGRSFVPGSSAASVPVPGNHAPDVSGGSGFQAALPARRQFLPGMAVPVPAAETSPGPLELVGVTRPVPAQGATGLPQRVPGRAFHTWDAPASAPGIPALAANPGREQAPPASPATPFRPPAVPGRAIAFTAPPARAPSPQPPPSFVSPPVVGAPVARVGMPPPPSLKGGNRKEALSLPEVPVVDTAPTGDERFERVNDVQVRYLPMSTVNPTGAVIPTLMASATRRALEKLTLKVGDIDEWISGRLRWNRTELGQYLTSEQVDAVALGLDKADQGQGMIVADQTGFGKGRILAAILRAVILSGRPAIFCTEKANLFSDFWRDVRDIGSEDVFGRPFMLNDKAKITDTASAEGAVVVPAWKKVDVSRVLKSGKLPDGCRLMMATYSQFNRKGTAKSNFLEAVAPGSHIILDEAHNFVGESNTAKTVGTALRLAKGSTFSSATFARDVTNLAAYVSVFPWLRRIEGMDEMTPAWRRALAEESVRLATEAGGIIRREHDLSNMVITVRVPEDAPTLERNEMMADKLAPILSGMAKLARKVDMLLKDRNEANKSLLEEMVSASDRKAERELWFTANFGSRLNAMIGQFLIALKVDACVDVCVDDLMQGEKPVVVIDATMESLMRELARDAEEADTEISDDEQVAPSADVDAEGEVSEVEVPPSERPATFREALAVMTDRLLRVSVRKGLAYEKMQVFLDDPGMVAMQAAIAALVADFPDLSLSPIDDIRKRIEEKGMELFTQNVVRKPWMTDEISARSMRVENGRYVSMPSVDRNISVARFVNGVTQALIITRSGATGLSIHDGPKFLDHKRRHMIELRAPPNVVERIQSWGRVFRRGQMTEPRFSTLSTGLPFEAYMLAVQNRKVQELCASVTGSGKTTTALAVPDPIDAIGNEVAYDFLVDNQSLADRMGITLNLDKEEADKELYFVGKLLRRLPLLSIDLQRKVFTAFMATYEDRMKSGVAAHLGKDLDGRWQPVRREVLEAGDGSDDPMEGRDVYVTTIRSRRESHPMTAEDVRAAVREARAKLIASPVAPYVTEIRSKRDAVLRAALPERRFASVERALSAQDDNSVKRADKKLRVMVDFLDRVVPGSFAKMPNEEDEPTDSIILDVRMPQLGNSVLPREYEIVYALPGDERPRTVSLAALVRQPEFRLGDPARAESMLVLFDAAPRGMVDIERKVLDGNGIGAVMAARRMGSGTRTSYTDHRGRRCHGILVPKEAERRLVAQQGRTAVPQVAMAVLVVGGIIRSDALMPAEGIELKPDGRGGVDVVIPASKRSAKPFESAEILALTGEFKGEGRGRKARVPLARVADLLPILARAECSFHYEARYRRTAIDATRAHARARAAAPSPDPAVPFPSP